MKTKIMLFIAAFLLLISSAGQASGWSLDRAHSSINFTVQHMVISEVAGTFKDFNVTFASIKEDFSDAVIDATLAVKSIDTGNERRDGHLKTDDFFNADKFPNIRFHSTAFEKTGDRLYKIKGLLTIRDTTKEVTIDASLTGMIPSKSGTRTGWKASLAINRFDYGLKWDKTIETGGLVAGDTVHLIFNMEFVK